MTFFIKEDLRKCPLNATKSLICQIKKFHPETVIRFHPYAGAKRYMRLQILRNFSGYRSMAARSV